MWHSTRKFRKNIRVSERLPQKSALPRLTDDQEAVPEKQPKSRFRV